MIVPTPRLMWLTGLLACPALTLAGIQPEQAILCLGIVSGLILIAAFDAVRGSVLLTSLGAELPPVSRLVKGRPGMIRLRLLHSPRLADVVRIGLALPPGFESTQPDQVARLPDAPASLFDWPVTAPDRGRFHIRTCHIETTSPMGLWLHRRLLPVHGEVRVQPDLASALRANAAFLARALTGSKALRQVGKGRDFEKLRDYIAGDSFDEIHWRATAKRQHPVTKIFQVERTQEVYVLVDASRLSGRVLPPLRPGPQVTRREPLLEQFIQSALLLGAAAEHQGDRFGLITFASRVESFVRADNGGGHFANCREQLVNLHVRPVTPDFEELASFIRVRLRRRALLLFLTSLDDPVAAEGFIRGIDLLRRQHLCLVVQPQAPDAQPVFSHDGIRSLDDIHVALAGHLQWRGLREIQSVLHRRGVTLATAASDGLAAALITRYLDVKRRQAL
jgi:uncharacterized protein (DUF58 family)